MSTTLSSNNPDDGRFSTEASPGRAYHCQCGRPVFFRNSQCLACGTQLGYDAIRGTLLPMAPGPLPDTWQAWGEPDSPLMQRCANFTTASGCNWMVQLDNAEHPPAEAAEPVNTTSPSQPLEVAAPSADAPAAEAAPAEAPADVVPHNPTLCLACALNRTIPDLSLVENQGLWRKVETAKRRLVSQLLLLGLPVKSRVAEDPSQGLAFDLLHSTDGGPSIMTGHSHGIITINIEEADDAVRERVRAAMHEPYRTLLGHFRHEVGHYYWDRLVLNSHWLDDYRTLFGDEREDYGASLQRHYQEGPPPDWAQRFVSSYASTHPWEDWAECWAHYLHMMDTVGTAQSFGVNSQAVDLDHEPFASDVLWNPNAPDAVEFLEFVNGWVRLTAVFNELSRSMGQHDFYPFVLPRAVVGKLQFIHFVVQEAAREEANASLQTNAQPDVQSAPVDQPTNQEISQPADQQAVVAAVAA